MDVLVTRIILGGRQGNVVPVLAGNDSAEYCKSKLVNRENLSLLLFIMILRPGSDV